MSDMAKAIPLSPDDLKAQLSREAARRGASEADIVRQALRHELGQSRARPHGALFTGREPIAERVDELLAGFGDA